MPLLDSILGGGLASTVKGIVGSFKLSPQAQLEFDAKLAEHEYALKMREQDLSTKAFEYEAHQSDVASANIRAELATGDKYTSRARPSVIYVFLALIVNNYMVMPWFGRAPAEIPSELWWPLCTVIGGYVGMRGMEKWQTRRKR